MFAIDSSKLIWQGSFCLYPLVVMTPLGKYLVWIRSLLACMVQNLISPLLLILVCHLKRHTFVHVIRSQRLQSNESLYLPLFSTSWCAISHCVWMITPPCWQNWQPFMRNLNTKSAVRHPQIDGFIECVDETWQITMHCYSSGFFIFLIGYLVYPWLIFITIFQPMKLRHISSFLWIYHLAIWSIMASDWCIGSLCQPLVWLGKCLKCRSRVANALQTMNGFPSSSTSRFFCSW